jgi:hypothetical protein
LIHRHQLPAFKDSSGGRKGLKTVYDLTEIDSSPIRRIVQGAMRTFVPPFGPRLQFLAIAVAGLMLAGIWIVELMSWHLVDWLLISGWFMLLVGLRWAREMPEELEQGLDRLAQRRVLAVTPERLCRFKRELEASVVKRWAPSGGLLVALGIALAFAIVCYKRGPSPGCLLLAATETLGGYIAGCYLGRLACYGTLGVRLFQEGFVLRVVAGHLDGAGGLRPVGDFYFRQAMIVALPAVYLAVWLLLMPLDRFKMYGVWRKPYALLLALAIAFEWLAFFWPLWSFHREMAKQKRVLLPEADRLSSEIADIQHRLEEGPPGDDAKALRETLADKTVRYWAIEQLPVWPISPRVKRLFSINSAALFIPFIAEITGLSKPWVDLVNGLIQRVVSPT